MTDHSSFKDLKHKDLYYVAVKLFLEKDGMFYVMKDKWGDGDLPGGRVRTYEFETPLDDVIRRKADEELGENVEYELGRPMVMMRHERVEKDPSDNPTIRIFAVGYGAKLLNGEPRVGHSHVEGKWVDIQTFEPKGYFSGGWLKGVQEYLNFKRSKSDGKRT